MLKYEKQKPQSFFLKEFSEWWGELCFVSSTEGIADCRVMFLTGGTIGYSSTVVDTSEKEIGDWKRTHGAPQTTLDCYESRSWGRRTAMSGEWSRSRPIDGSFSLLRWYALKNKIFLEILIWKSQKSFKKYLVYAQLHLAQWSFVKLSWRFHLNLNETLFYFQYLPA